ncbi:MAG: F0F1-type synthase, alpha subunit [Planctomycetota bacterium]|nr:F0F1-type synthase, alpha subunit [Planctomycetota bacterium]
MAQGHSSNPLSHVVDHNTLELPGLPEIDLPNIFGFQITRFMVMEVVAALLVILVIVPFARHVAKRPVTRGRLMNIFEVFILFIRDGIARPAIDAGHDDHGDDHGHGKHKHIPEHHDPLGDEGGLLGAGPGTSHAPGHSGRDSDVFMPFLWTMFFFILFCNLLGMIPGGASATGNINVTVMLAALTLITVFISGMRAMGVAGFWVSIVPKMDVPIWLKPMLWGLMFVIEVMGLFIRHIVLSVRLFANMLAGHIVLAVILGFVAQAVGMMTFLVTPASILGSVALSLLELFVAFLQAYIFTFLAALFIGSAAHPH